MKLLGFCYNDKYKAISGLYSIRKEKKQTKKYNLERENTDMGSLIAERSLH
jgi:hypothetical protein